MGAARYIGRVGGLAVALGVGTAIVTGQGVASATTGSEDKPNTEAPATPNAGDPGGSNDNGGVKIKKGPRVAGILGRHSADLSTATSSLATSIVDRLSEKQTKRLPRLSPTDRIAAQNSDDKPPKNDDPTSNADINNAVTATKVVVDKIVVDKVVDKIVVDKVVDKIFDNPGLDKPALQAPRVMEWLASPSVVAGRTAKPTPPLSSLWTPPTTGSTIPAPQGISSLVETALTGVLSPFAGNSPLAPSTDLPLSWVMLAASRKEFSTEAAPQAYTSQALLVTPSTPYDIVVYQGVITGCAVNGCATTSDGLPLTYTVVGDPSNGGKVIVNPTTGKFTFLPFADQNANGPTGTESFKVLVAQTTQFDTFLVGLPLVGTTIFVPVITTLQQVPIVSVVLAPLIGAAYVQQIDADSTTLSAGKPIAYTTMVTSFDGTKISTNYFPAIGTPAPSVSAATPTVYPTILNGPGLASAGATSPDDPFVATFRNQGYNVVTWDPRGEFDSGGVLQLDSPQYEGRDVSQIITWVAGKPGVELDSPGDPRVGMVGVSYGGGIQLVTAANDKRIDAIAPGWSWNSLPGSLYPDDAFKTAYSSLLLLGLVTTGATINTGIYGGIITGALLGILTPSQIALLAGSGPSVTVSNITAPTLLIQGTVDVLFPLEQSVINAGYLTTSTGPTDPVAVTKVIWFCGGHGSCLPGQGDAATDQAWALNETVAWMNRYVKEDGTTDPQVFEWSDQNGDYWYSTKLPSDPTFATGVLHSEGTGKILPIIPIIGGSGPQTEVDLPYSLGDGAEASNAVNIPISAPVATATNPTGTTNVVGAPELTMTYSGVGTSKHVYAQIVDEDTGLVVGNLVTPVPVTLDGQEHTVTVPLNDIAYTMTPSSHLKLQIVTSATPYLNLTEYGAINVSDVSLDLPTTTNAISEGSLPTPVPVAV